MILACLISEISILVRSRQRSKHSCHGYCIDPYHNVTCMQILCALVLLTHAQILILVRHSAPFYPPAHLVPFARANIMREITLSFNFSRIMFARAKKGEALRSFNVHKKEMVRVS